MNVNKLQWYVILIQNITCSCVLFNINVVHVAVGGYQFKKTSSQLGYWLWKSSSLSAILVVRTHWARAKVEPC